MSNATYLLFLVPLYALYTQEFLINFIFVQFL